MNAITRMRTESARQVLDSECPATLPPSFFSSLALQMASDARDAEERRRVRRQRMHDAAMVLIGIAVGASVFAIVRGFA